jgi:cephalosporin-C deacetylase-like acetyl esterase
MPLLSGLIVVLATTSAAAGSAQAEWMERSEALRQRVREVLTLPVERVDPDPVTHRRLESDGYTIECVTYASEPGSRVTAALYLPAAAGTSAQRIPAVVIACGHGGSKSSPYAQYAGQLYAKLGFACLVPDTIGEEERDNRGRMGSRGHDLYHLGDQNPEFIRTKLKRMVLGKIVWDLIRGIDYLQTRPEVDGRWISVAGSSLGGASAGGVAIVDQRVRAAIISGWAFRKRYGETTKYCTRMPYAEFAGFMGFDEMTALLAPHAATLFMIGERDAIVDPDEAGAATVRELRAHIASAHRILSAAGVDGVIEAFVEPGADHRPYIISHGAADWIIRHGSPPGRHPTAPQGAIRYGDWVEANGQRIEPLYAIESRHAGLAMPDIGAIYRDRRELACFPDRAAPTPEYSMQGWIDAVLGGGGETGEAGKPQSSRRNFLRALTGSRAANSRFLRAQPAARRP